MGRFAFKPNLTLDMVSHNKQNSTNLDNPWVGEVLLIVTDYIQG